jgi:hypothetical protein
MGQCGHPAPPRAHDGEAGQYLARHRSGRAANVTVPLFIAWERLLECLRDRQGRIAGQLASMRATVPYKRAYEVERRCPFGRARS